MDILIRACAPAPAPAAAPATAPTPAPAEEASIADAEIDALIAAAFPEEELRPLTRELRALPDTLALAAEAEGALAGIVVFTPCALTAADAGLEAGVSLSLLGPLAVAPGLQRRGVGSALVRAGLERLKANGGAASVLVLGDPAYYSRFGFAEESAITAPYPLPADWGPAWRSLALEEPAQSLRGRLAPPAPWLRPSYWGA